MFFFQFSYPYRSPPPPLSHHTVSQIRADQQTPVPSSVEHAAFTGAATDNLCCCWGLLDENPLVVCLASCLLPTSFVLSFLPLILQHLYLSLHGDGGWGELAQFYRTDRL